MIRCNNCGTDNLDGSEYCDECGMKLSASLPVPPQAAGTVPPVRPATPPIPPPVQNIYNPVPVSPSSQPERHYAEPARQAPPPSQMPPTRVDPVAAGVQQASQNRPSAGGQKVQGTRAKLIIQRGGTIGKEFVLADGESNIGRWDADGGIFPDVDLDQDDPEAKVSRRHARIIHQNGQYLIEDLGSTNGTFINRGRRLLPGNRHPLNNGDEIIVGKTFLKLVIE